MEAVRCPLSRGFKKLGKYYDVIGEFPKKVEFIFSKNVIRIFFITLPISGQSP